MEHMIMLGRDMVALKYTVNSVCCLEERYGKALHDMLHTDVAAVRALLWCGMLHADDAITPEDVGDMLENALEKGQALSQIGEACAQALSDAGFFRFSGRQKRRSRSGKPTCA